MDAPPAPSPNWAWFLDVDGTLIEIAETPSAIHVPAGLPDMLSALSRRHDGALALVSGRSVENIGQLVAPARLAASGLHGLERTGADGRRLPRPQPAAGLDAVREVLGEFAAGHPGVLLEDKGLTLALHYRQVPALEPACRAAAEAAVACRPGFGLMAGRMVFEVRPAGTDKGSAVRAFMAEPPFAGRVPIFVGDDLTDEDGFAAALALGGFAVLVGPERPTAANWRLAEVAELRDWLGRAAVHTCPGDVPLALPRVCIEH